MKNCNMILTKKEQKYQQLSSGNIDKCEYLTGEEILPFNQIKITEQDKFIYSPLGKAFEKQTKSIEDQGKKQIKAIEDHGKQWVISNEVIKKDLIPIIWYISTKLKEEVQKI